MLYERGTTRTLTHTVKQRYCNRSKKNRLEKKMSTEWEKYACNTVFVYTSIVYMCVYYMLNEWRTIVIREIVIECSLLLWISRVWCVSVSLCVCECACVRVDQSLSLSHLHSSSMSVCVFWACARTRQVYALFMYGWLLLLLFLSPCYSVSPSILDSHFLYLYFVIHYVSIKCVHVCVCTSTLTHIRFVLLFVLIKFIYLFFLLQNRHYTNAIRERFNNNITRMYVTRNCYTRYENSTMKAIAMQNANENWDELDLP